MEEGLISPDAERGAISTSLYTISTSLTAAVRSLGQRRSAGGYHVPIARLKLCAPVSALRPYQVVRGVHRLVVVSQPPHLRLTMNK